MGTNADELRRDIEQTRSEMSEHLDAIGDRVSPRRMAERRWDRTRAWFGSARTSILGSSEHAVDTMQQAPAAVADRARGNPMVAGAVAFGAGFLASLMVGATQGERQAVAEVQDQLEPIKEEVAASTRSVASTVQEAGKDAARGLAAEAGDRAGRVTEAARSPESS